MSRCPSAATTRASPPSCCSARSPGRRPAGVRSTTRTRSSGTRCRPGWTGCTQPSVRPRRTPAWWWWDIRDCSTVRSATWRPGSARGAGRAQRDGRPVGADGPGPGIGAGVPVRRRAHGVHGPLGVRGRRVDQRPVQPDQRVLPSEPVGPDGVRQPRRARASCLGSDVSPTCQRYVGLETEIPLTSTGRPARPPNSSRSGRPGLPELLLLGRTSQRCRRGVW